MNNFKKHIGYFILNSNQKYDFYISKTEFKDEDFTKFNKHINVLEHLNPTLVLHKSVILSYEELIDNIEKHHKRISDFGTPTVGLNSLLLTYYVEANQKVVNFISSATAFLNCTEVKLKELFGEKSAPFKQWNQKRKSLHAESFAYRLMYELRNFSQHYSLPIGKIEINQKLESGRTTDLNTLLTLSKDQLLKRDYNWKRLKTDIEEAKELIEIMPLAKEYISIINSLSLEFFMVFSKDIINCKLYLDSLINEFKFPEGCNPCIFYGNTQQDSHPPKNYKPIPYEHFEWVLSHFDTLARILKSGFPPSRE